MIGCAIAFVDEGKLGSADMCVCIRAMNLGGGT
jgi:hypothetical protein